MLALDDFGTGYSSLTHLLNYPVDTIKVDRAFIANLGRDEVSNTIVTGVTNLAHGLGMSVVAEGVETVQQRDELTRMGCDSCQGFYFARPMSASALEALMHEHIFILSPEIINNYPEVWGEDSPLRQHSRAQLFVSAREMPQLQNADLAHVPAGRIDHRHPFSGVLRRFRIVC